MTTMGTMTTLFVSTLLMAHLASPYPAGSGQLHQPRSELLLLQDLLDSLESLSEQRAIEVSQRSDELDVSGLQSEQEVGLPLSQRALEGAPGVEDDRDEVLIRELLSAKNLKQVRNNSNRNSSNCFGRRMDSIGSMSSLGCNTLGRNNAKSS